MPRSWEDDVLEGAALVGVGEDAHGELVSWPVRIKLLRAAIKRMSEPSRGPVFVFVEQLHPFLAAMNARAPRFRLHEGTHFYPYLLHRANMSVEHLTVHRKLRRMAATGRVRFVGVDVQAAEFPWLWEQLPGGDAGLDALVRAVVARHAPRFLRARNRGSVRNRCNARIIRDLMGALQPVDPSFYWAHNGHVAKASRETREAHPAYELEGALLGRWKPAVSYRAVLTYSPRLWHVWAGPQRLAREQQSAARELFGGRPQALPRLPSNVELSGLFRDGDADWYVTVPEAPRMRMLKRETSLP